MKTLLKELEERPSLELKTKVFQNRELYNSFKETLFEFLSINQYDFNTNSTFRELMNEYASIFGLTFLKIHLFHLNVYHAELEFPTREKEIVIQEELSPSKQSTGVYFYISRNSVQRISDIDNL